MPKGIGTLARGFWQAAKKLGRAWSATLGDAPSCLPPNDIRENLQEETLQLETISSALREQMGDDAYYRLPSLFTEMPFISPKEKDVQAVLLAEEHPFIVLADNGFREYYKPADSLFDACASGRVLILSPWPYDANKRHISRADCVALNTMAEEICNHLSNG